MKLPVTSCPQLQPSESSEYFLGGMFKLNAKSDAGSLLYSLSHFECHGHTVHMLTQCCLPPPLTSIVKSSLFTLVHSSPLFLAARLHRCHTNCSHCVNNGWTLSRQTSYLWAPDCSLEQATPAPKPPCRVSAGVCQRCRMHRLSLVQGTVQTSHSEARKREVCHGSEGCLGIEYITKKKITMV